MTRREQIEAKIAARSHYEDRGYETPCRIWDGPKSGDPEKTRGHGYGRMNLDGATVAVHIAAWVNVNGLIPPRKQLDHLCHQRDCCEERHLKLKTHKQNQRNKKPKLSLVEVDLAHIEQRVVAAMMDAKPLHRMPGQHEPVEYGHTITGRMRRANPNPWGGYNENVPAPDGFDPTNPSDSSYKDQVIGHDIPADRLPPAAPMVEDE